MNKKDFPQCAGCKFNVRYGDIFVCCFQEKSIKEGLPIEKTGCKGIQKREWIA